MPADTLKPSPLTRPLTRDELQDRLAFVTGPVYRVTEVQPPSALAIDVDDTFQFVVAQFSGLAPVMFLTLRILRMDGQIVSLFRQIPVANSRAQVSSTFAGTQGWLLSATLFPNLSTLQRGTCYASLNIVRGDQSNPVIGLQLFSGYTDNINLLSWPQGRSEAMNSGLGRVRSITGTAPAAGAEIAEVVPNNALWQVNSFKTVLTASGAAGNRTPDLLIDDGAIPLWQSPSSIVIIASQVATSYWAPNLPARNSGSLSNQPMPQGIYLPPGFRIRSATTGILAGDQYGAPQYEVVEWLQP